MMATSATHNFSRLTTNYLPAYAGFLLDHCLDDYARKQAELFRKFDVTLPNNFPLQDKLQGVLRLQAVEMLTQLSEKKADNQIQEFITRWATDQPGVKDLFPTIAENIALLCFIRKQALLFFVENYTQEPKKIVALVREIDQYILKLESAALLIFTNLLDRRLNEQALFNEKLTNSSPCIIFVFDRLEHRLVYANKKVEETMGYTPEMLQALGSDILVELIHPEDLPGVLDVLNQFEKAADSDVLVCEYRVRDTGWGYHWIRSYGSVFKRNNNGIPSQVLASAINIDDEKINSEKLKYHEEQLQKTIAELRQNEDLFKEAQHITHIGNFVWNFKTNKIEWSDELYRIHGLEPQSVEPTYDFVLAFNHPDDADRNRELIQTAIRSGQPIDFHYRIISRDGKTKMLHAKGRVLYDNKQIPLKLIGTAQDVTERHELIQNLLRSQELYKQAQTLSSLGNWRWELKTNSITWSDELYNIFGIAPRAELSFDEFLSLIHPHDKSQLLSAIRTSVEKQVPYEAYHRIVRRDGTVRHLHSKGNIEKAHGQPFALFGITQDVTEQQILIERLERSEALYKEAQAISHLGNWTFDLQEKKMTWTDEVFRIAGLEPQSVDLTPERLLEMIHPDDREFVKGFALKALAVRSPFELHYRLVRPDGTVKIVHVRGEIFTDENGKPFRLFGTTQDVTEQKILEEKLRDNQNFVQKIADAAPSIICSYDAHTGQYLFVNNSVQTLLGYDPQQVLTGGLAFVSSLIHPEDLEKILEENAVALEKVNREGPQEGREAVFEFKYRMRHADGRYRWIQTFGTVFERDDNQMVRNILNISFDITEQLEAEALIREQEHFINHIVEASPNILYVFDLEEETFVYVNREVEILLGYTAAEIMALDKTATQELYHPNDLSLLPYRRQAADAIIEPISHFECRMKNKQGNWRWLLTREVVFRRHKHGRPQQLVGAALDITDRKEMEIMLKQKTFQLEQSNASLEEFAYIASHDLKEPLRKISSFGDRLMAKHVSNLDEDGKLFLGKMVESSKRMQAMITDLLSVSRLSGNKSFEFCNLNELLNETLQTLELEIEKKSAVVEATSLPGARIIPSQMRQLFQNLLSNSLKFVRHDVTPVIKITHRPVCANEAAKLNLPGSKQYLRIDVTDNGIGFDNQFTGKIFAIFQRLHGRSEYGGTGIGLTICKKIVENHEGLIIADSKPGQGSVFSVIIPV